MKKLCAIFVSVALVLSLFLCIPAQAATIVAEGIDVSYWQGGNINWSGVASHSHGDFAILRAYCYGKDQYFDVNYTRAKQAGVPIGAYCYIYGTTTAAVQSEINALLSVIQGKQFEYPIYIDIEDTATYAGIGRQAVTNLVKTACQMLENAGFYAGVYTYTSFAASYIYMDQLTAYTTWIADYRGYVGYGGAYDMWQYGCEGSVGGISPVDVNYCYLDFPTIIKNGGFNNYEPSVTYPYDVDSNTKMLYDGESKNSITTAFSTNVSIYSGAKTQGDNSLKMTFTNPTANANSTKMAGMAIFKFTQTANLSNYDYIQFDIYFGRKMTGSNGFQINFISDTTEDGYNCLKAINDYEVGWHTISLKKSDIGKAVSSANWSNINKIRFSWWNYSGLSGETYILIDNLRAMKSITQEIIYPYAVNDNTLMLNDGEAVLGIQESFYTIATATTSAKTQGSSSLKLDFSRPAASSDKGNVGGAITQTLKGDTNLKDYDYFEMDVYFSRNMTGSHSLQVNFAANGGESGYNYKHSIGGYTKGWHTIRVNFADIPVGQSSNANWRKINTIRYVWYNDSLQTDTTYFLLDNVRAVKEAVVEPPVEDPVDPPVEPPVDEPVVTVKYGDVNNDGMVNAGDALAVLRFTVAKEIFSKEQMVAAEVDGDQEITAKDALYILRYTVGSIAGFPVESK